MIDKTYRLTRFGKILKLTMNEEIITEYNQIQTGLNFFVSQDILRHFMNEKGLDNALLVSNALAKKFAQDIVSQAVPEYLVWLIKDETILAWVEANTNKVLLREYQEMRGHYLSALQYMADWDNSSTEYQHKHEEQLDQAGLFIDRYQEYFKKLMTVPGVKIEKNI